MSNRQLFRPDRSAIEQRIQEAQEAEAASDRISMDRDAVEERPAFAPRRRPVPPDATSAEAFYYLKQMNAKTPMVVMLDNGEELRGIIEWYDRNCIKLHRQGAPNLLLMKRAIRYMFKADE